MEHKLYAPLMLSTLNQDTRKIYLEKLKKAGNKGKDECEIMI